MEKLFSGGSEDIFACFLFYISEYFQTEAIISELLDSR